MEVSEGVARMANVDLTGYSGESMEGTPVPSIKTAILSWADYMWSKFNRTGPISRYDRLRIVVKELGS